MSATRPLIEDVDWSSTRQRMVAADGADLAVWHTERATDQWVVWVHGAGTSHLSWGYQLDAFGDVNHVFVDVRGHGESRLHAGRVADFDDVVADLGCVLDTFDVRRAVLIGHSWGGNPVQEFGFRHPERAAGIVMVGAWGQIRTLAPAERLWIRVMGRMYGLLPWTMVASTNSRACSDRPETRQLLQRNLLAAGRDVFLDLGKSAYAQVHDVEAFPVPTPTLLVRGSLDTPRYLEPIYRGLQAKNPGAREVVISGTKHVPMIDAADEFNRALATFLDEVWSGGES